MGRNKYILARKTPKLYMRDVISYELDSITTAKHQTLYLDGYDAEFMKGKRVLIVDDVISTGESLRALENLVNEAGGEIVGKMAVLAEGDATDRKDIIYLEKLPLFNADGSEI
jgi:adenine phosphoribosyltransferase